MDLNEIKSFLAENAEKDDVKSYLAELSQVSKERESEIIESYKKSKDYTSEIDRAVSKAVLSHDEKIKPKLEKELRDKIQLELNPPKDPAVITLQKQLEELQKAQDEKDAIIAQKERVNFWHTQINPEFKELVKLFDGSIQDDAEKVKFINTTLFDKLAKGSPKPINQTATGKSQLTDDDLSKMKPSEIVKAKEEGRLDSLLGRTN